MELNVLPTSRSEPPRVVNHHILMASRDATLLIAHAAHPCALWQTACREIIMWFKTLCFNDTFIIIRPSFVRECSFQSASFPSRRIWHWPQGFAVWRLACVWGEQEARASEWKWHPSRLTLPCFDFLLHIFQLYLGFKLEPNYPITCISFSDHYAERAEYLVLAKFLFW